jgi:hypothetical protein
MFQRLIRIFFSVPFVNLNKMVYPNELNTIIKYMSFCNDVKYEIIMASFERHK